MDHNKEYRGLAAIAERLGRSPKVVMKAIRRKTDPLPATPTRLRQYLGPKQKAAGENK